MLCSQIVLFQQMRCYVDLQQHLQFMHNVKLQSFVLFQGFWLT